jgi:hypothetical protein
VPPDFLNSREDAIVLWAVALLGFVLYKNPREVGGSMLAVVRAALHPKLLLLFGSALAYSAVVIYVATELGLWHRPALKVTVYWFVGTAIVLAGSALTDGARDRQAYLRKVLRRVLAVTIVVEFVVGVYSLPLVLEIALVGAAIVFTGVQVVAQHDPKTPPITRKFIEGVLVAVGLVWFGYFVVRVATDVSGFLTRENAEDFFVPPVLTLALVPFLLGAPWLSRREQENLRRRFEARAASSRDDDLTDRRAA